jgi:hypothetical protein
MNRIYTVEPIRAGKQFLYLTVDGQTSRIRWEDCSPRLAKATYPQRRFLQVSPSGYSIHWPEVDEDLAITPLLKQAQPLEGGNVHQGARQART